MTKLKLNNLLKILFFLLFPEYTGWAQKGEVLQIEPPFWWSNLGIDTLQLMIYGKGLSKATAFVDYPGVTVLSVSSLESQDYLFVNLAISAQAKAERFPIIFKIADKRIKGEYELKERSELKGRNNGFNSSDLIYLIMPDRFSNGDPKNDAVKGLIETPERTRGDGRHGGDLKGIGDHLDYIKELGATTIWINPVLENNMPHASYHGYAITDLYSVDQRFGTNQDYLSLVEKCHDKGLKIIMDMVHNHIGLNHWWMKDLPSKDWIHQFETFTRSNYNLATVSDPHASEIDKNLMEKGWFDKSMPDLNQSNPYLAKYLIQNSIWWIEYSGIDGIRMDTYPYPDKEFMTRWSSVIQEIYPKFKIVGEVWNSSPSIESYWLKESSNNFNYSSGLPSVTDFPIQDAILKAVNENFGWNEGLGKLYNIVAEDFLYENPNENVIFLDNHDMTRVFSSVGENLKKFKQAIAILMTMRGVPQLYYGAEILMLGDGAKHSEVRKDFLGGWAGDSRSAFTAEGRTPKENEAFDYIKALANWRKGHAELMKAKLTHFIPEESTYIYFRHTEKEAVMVLINSGKEPKRIDTQRFQERLSGYIAGRDVATGQVQKDLSQITIEGEGALVLELTDKL